MALNPRYIFEHPRYVPGVGGGGGAWLQMTEALKRLTTRYLYLLSFVETPRKFIIAELSIRKLGSSSVL